MSKNKGPIMIVAGTRPEAIKLSPVIEWLDRLKMDYIFVWSGQHYDYEMSKVFFEQLRLPEPDIDLNVKSGSHAEQTAKIIYGLEKTIEKYKPSIVVSEGDTNTVVSSALTSVKCLTPYAHVEAGIRSWNFIMPEEINRKIADSIATLHFAPTEIAAVNLAFEGIAKKSIYITGNTILDVIYKYIDKILGDDNGILLELGLEKGRYIVVTLHRAENTDNRRRLKSILKALEKLSQQYTIVFPIHPRTLKNISRYNLERYLDKMKLTKPLGYFQFLALLSNSRVVLTDSGGVQEEAFTLKIPTVTLRYNTERPETTTYEINVLAGVEEESIIKLTLRQIKRYDEIKKLTFKNPLGDGKAGKKIAEILKKKAEDGLSLKEPDLRNMPFVTYVLLNKREIGTVSEPIIGFTKEGIPILKQEKMWRILARTPGRLNDKSGSNPK